MLLSSLLRQILFCLIAGSHTSLAAHLNRPAHKRPMLDRLVKRVTSHGDRPTGKVSHHGKRPRPTSTSGMDKGPASTSTPVWPVANQSSGPGTLPLKVESVKELGELKSPALNVGRDLGFSGVLGGQIIWTFGDSLWFNDAGEWRGMVTDSAALGNLSTPDTVYDFVDDKGCLSEWIQANEEEVSQHGPASDWAFFGTQVIEPVVGSGEGLVYYLRDHRPNGNSTIQGAGVARVRLDKNDKPYTTRSKTVNWTKDEPFYGDCFILAHEDYVYAWGHGPFSAGELHWAIFATRVKASKALKSRDAYEYWDGSEWQDKIIISEEAAVFPPHSAGQGQMFWSNYYNCFILICDDGKGWKAAYARTAPHPEGPWSDVTKVYADTTDSDFAYAYSGHPEYDQSGKTVLVSYSQTTQKILQLLITWE